MKYRKNTLNPLLIQKLILDNMTAFPKHSF